MNLSTLYILGGLLVLILLLVVVWVSDPGKRRYVAFIFMILLGSGGGLYYAWVVSPVEFVDATIYHLRPDYKADFVLMTAEIYDQDRSVYEALRRLDLMGESSVEQIVMEAVTLAEGLGYSEMDLNKMNALYYALIGTEPTPTPVVDLTLIAEYAMTSTAEILEQQDKEEGLEGDTFGEGTGQDVLPWNINPEEGQMVPVSTAEAPAGPFQPDQPLAGEGGDRFFDDPLEFSESDMAEWANGVDQ